MFDVYFYQIRHETLPKVIIQLIKQVQNKGWKIEICSNSEQDIQYLDQYLWQYEEGSFIPHGLSSEDYAEQQPVLLSHGLSPYDESTVEKSEKETSLNEAEVWCGLGLVVLPDLNSYKRIIIVFREDCQDSIDYARKCWKYLRGQSQQMHYWKQAGDGWVKHKMSDNEHMN